MIIYSIKIKIDKSIEHEWLDWMKNKHIPDLMDTELFETHEIYTIINGIKNNVFVIQYTLKNMVDFLKYEKEFAERFREEHKLKFKNKFSAKRIIMKKI